MIKNDEHWMRLALETARQGIGRTSPNPVVGAVLVSSSGKLIGQGCHMFPGGPHAEVNALTSVKPDDRASIPGSTLYITLEPCCTESKTPPCTNAILQARPARVVYAMDDPNPLHAGKARSILTQAGIEVTVGVCKAEGQELLRSWCHFISTGKPYVIAKAGMSLDGRIARPSGEGQWISNSASREDAISLRVWADAILIGAETVRQDNPSLTIRNSDATWKLQPWRVVLTRSGQLPDTCNLLTDSNRERTLMWPGKNLAEALGELGKLGVVNLLIEGGGKVLAEAFSQGLVDEFHVYLAPLICGTKTLAVDATTFANAPSVPLALKAVQQFGEDMKLIYRAHGLTAKLEE